MSTKRRALAKPAAPVVKSTAKWSAKTTINESRASVSTNDALVNIQADSKDLGSGTGSDVDVSDDEQDGAADHSNENPEASKALAQINGQKTPQTDEVDDAGSHAAATSPSFGELLRGNKVIDVTALLQQSSPPENDASTPAAQAVTVPKYYLSLATVLSQALRTDDKDLLESCLRTTNSETIRKTTEHIDSSLADILLQKLAARLYASPGRPRSLLAWVRWTLIAHGGVLAVRPRAFTSLKHLQKVLSERARGLQSLLALKGRLDLLEGQMELRANMQRRSQLTSELIRQGGGEADDDEDDDNDDDVVFVEGEEGEQQDVVNGARSQRNTGGALDDDDDEDDDDNAVIANGFIGDSEDEEDVSEVDDEDGSGIEEPLDGDEVDYDDVDESMGENEESDVEAAPPSKLQKVARSFRKMK